MAAISSTAGIVSGIDYTSIVNELIQIDARPIQRLIDRTTRLENEQAALMDLSQLFSRMAFMVESLNKSSPYEMTSVTSSNDSILSASRGSSGIVGSYTFTALKKAQGQQSISTGGVKDASVALGKTGEISIRHGNDMQSGLNYSLDDLNGGDGISKGHIRIVDGNGNRATIDLRNVTTINDVIDTLNSQTEIDISAHLDGNHIVLNDLSGGTGVLKVQEVGGGSTAKSLGLLSRNDGSASHEPSTSDDGLTITGGSILYIGVNTRLSLLNDGNGVATEKTLDDLVVKIGYGNAGDLVRIKLGTVHTKTVTDPNDPSQTAEVQEFIPPKTVGDILNAINGSGSGIVASIANGERLMLTYDNGYRDGDPEGTAYQNLTIVNANYTPTLQTLGFSNTVVRDGTSEGVTTQDGMLLGRSLIGSFTSGLTSSLNGGAGLWGGELGSMLAYDSGGKAQIRIGDRTGDTAVISFTQAELMGKDMETIEGAIAMFNKKIAEVNQQRADGGLAPIQLKVQMNASKTGFEVIDSAVGRFSTLFEDMRFSETRYFTIEKGGGIPREILESDLLPDSTPDEGVPEDKFRAKDLDIRYCTKYVPAVPPEEVPAASLLPDSTPDEDVPPGQYRAKDLNLKYYAMERVAIDEADILADDVADEDVPDGKYRFKDLNLEYYTRDDPAVMIPVGDILADDVADADVPDGRYRFKDLEKRYYTDPMPVEIGEDRIVEDDVPDEDVPEGSYKRGTLDTKYFTDGVPEEQPFWVGEEFIVDDPAELTDGMFLRSDLDTKYFTKAAKEIAAEDIVPDSTPDDEVPAGKYRAKDLNVVTIDFAPGLAAAFGIDGFSNTGKIAGTDAGFQTISFNTKLSDLNGGKGVNMVGASISFTDSTRVADPRTGNLVNNTHIVDFADDRIKTVGDLIQAINSIADLNVFARINDSGDGIVLEETGGGENGLVVNDFGTSTLAAELGINGVGVRGTGAMGTGMEGKTVYRIEGSFSKKIEIEADDSLDAIAKKINDAGGNFSAAVMNDGSEDPWRLAINSKSTGANTRMVIDLSALDMSVENLMDAQDALVAYGDINGKPMMISSASNTFSNIAPGVSITVKEESDQPVTVTSTLSSASIKASITEMVKTYNEFWQKMDEYTKYDEENVGSILTGERVALQMKSKANEFFGRYFGDSLGSISTLSQLGITFQESEYTTEKRVEAGDGSEGSDLVVTSSVYGFLEFNEEVFDQMYATDPEAIKEFFYKQVEVYDETEKKYVSQSVGFSAQFKKIADELATGDVSASSSQWNTYETQINANKDRAEWMLARLEAKRTRLFKRFYHMETVLAKMQSQADYLDKINVGGAAATSALGTV
ncbi:MAG TPA: hypothetical protein DEB39_08985 [Planctomycetaceae bacterium]|nr:hypothetical protein [Planctomycetaceae bacterium]